MSRLNRKAGKNQAMEKTKQSTVGKPFLSIGTGLDCRLSGENANKQPNSAGDFRVISTKLEAYSAGKKSALAAKKRFRELTPA